MDHNFLLAGKLHPVSNSPSSCLCDIQFISFLLFINFGSGSRVNHPCACLSPLIFSVLLAEISCPPCVGSALNFPFTSLNPFSISVAGPDFLDDHCPVRHPKLWKKNNAIPILHDVVCRTRESPFPFLSSLPIFSPFMAVVQFFLYSYSVTP